MRYLLKLLILYILFCAAGFLLFAFLFSTPIFGRLDVFFYRGILLLLVTVCGIGIVMLLLKRVWLKNLLTFRDVVCCLCIVFSLNMLFFTHVPVTAERSVSIFTLGYMAQNADRTITEQEIEDYFIEQYVRNYGAFQKRFHEQMVTGTIQPVGEGYQITEKGKWLIRLYSLVADVFRINKMLIYPVDAMDS